MQGGRVQSRGAHGSTEGHLYREAGSGAEGHVAALEPTSTRRWGLEPWRMWQRQGPPQ
jgi:hypothetical protein